MKNLVLVFVIAFAFCTTAMAIEIGCSTQTSWWPEATAEREMQEIADSVPVSVEIFTSSQDAALAAWVVAHTGNGVSDLLILSGKFPDSIYPGGNAQPDGSIAELFLDDGNTIINTGDWMFYVGSVSNNTSGGLQNMMDIPNISMGDSNGDVAPTADGRLYTPSFGAFFSTRPFRLDELDNNWEPELILGQNPDGTRADPVIVINTVTGGRLGSFLQVSDGSIDDIRGDVISEWINNWYLKILADPALAGGPNPADETTDVPREVVISWTPGEFAAPTNGHKVYFSENFDDVNDGIGATTQSADSYAPPQRLDFNTTYYWRIDEVNAPPTSQIEFKGKIWSFTTEPIAYPIENITATASSAHQTDTGPENSINGLGLDANDLHSMEPADMWLSGDEPNGAWIQYELDKVHKLHEMWVWNSNGVMESVLGFGLKDVTIEYSTNGTDYTTLGTTHEFARAPAAVDYAHNTTIDFGGVTAKYVRLTTNSNWGAGLLDQYGLSEVRFFSIPVFAR
ncbi:MAG: discoidin domain-containing protein, partial [Planctomycetes bacterium]|nr:discoidin domain-containing protein [Planctomycetota bacterium]